MSGTWVELDLGVLQDNIRSLQEALGAGTDIVFVVKADAYGHGVGAVAPAARAAGVQWFAVAHAEEAFALREIVPDAEIIVVGAVEPADAIALRARGIHPVVVTPEHAEALRAALDTPAPAGKAGNGVLSVHAKIDTGMGRLGFAWDTAAESLAHLGRSAVMRLDGICTHLASSDRSRRAFAIEQVDRFKKVITDCEARGMRFQLRHLANSGAVLRHPEWDLDAVRVGILLYGYRPGGEAETHRDVATRPFLHWKSRVIQAKRVPAGFPVSYDSTYSTPGPTTIATLPVGYSDGYLRSLSNAGVVLLRGRRCPVVGRVTMNFITVDAGPESPVEVGDEAVLVGCQGSESIWADELAERCGTISYEILTSIRATDRRVVNVS